MVVRVYIDICPSLIAYRRTTTSTASKKIIMLKRQEAFILIPQARWCTVIPLGALVWIYCILNRREDPSKSPTSQTIDFFFLQHFLSGSIHTLKKRQQRQRNKGFKRAVHIHHSKQNTKGYKDNFVRGVATTRRHNRSETFFCPSLPRTHSGMHISQTTSCRREWLAASSS